MKTKIAIIILLIGLVSCSDEIIDPDEARDKGQTCVVTKTVTTYNFRNSPLNEYVETWNSAVPTNSSTTKYYDDYYVKTVIKSKCKSN